MDTILGFGCLVVLAFLSVAAELNSYSGKRRFWHSGEGGENR